jgi:hypothetical protein
MSRKFSDYFPELRGNNPVVFDFPIDLGDVVDANGNEAFEIDTVASAVNYLGFRNSATTVGPTVYAAGDDTNIDLFAEGKGSGYVGAAMASGSGGFRSKRSVLASSGNTTMTSAMSGSVMLIDGASTDYALPAIGAGDIGMYFDFVSTIISTGTQTITAQAADLLTGSIAIIDAGAAGTDTFSPDVTDDLIITLNGTTTGGVAVGSWCRLTAISATRWFVEGVFCGSGSLATPFS